MTQLLTASEAAERLRVPSSWLLREARADRIPHVRFGRYVRFDPDALEAWWRARVRGPQRSVPGSSPGATRGKSA